MFTVLRTTLKYYQKSFEDITAGVITEGEILIFDARDGKANFEAILDRELRDEDFGKIIFKDGTWIQLDFDIFDDLYWAGYSPATVDELHQWIDNFKTKRKYNN